MGLPEVIQQLHDIPGIMKIVRVVHSVLDAQALAVVLSMEHDSTLGACNRPEGSKHRPCTPQASYSLVMQTHVGRNASKRMHIWQKLQVMLAKVCSEPGIGDCHGLINQD